MPFTEEEMMRAQDILLKAAKELDKNQFISKETLSGVVSEYDGIGQIAKEDVSLGSKFNRIKYFLGNINPSELKELSSEGLEDIVTLNKAELELIKAESKSIDRQAISSATLSRVINRYDHIKQIADGVKRLKSRFDYVEKCLDDILEKREGDFDEHATRSEKLTLIQREFADKERMVAEVVEGLRKGERSFDPCWNEYSEDVVFEILRSFLLPEVRMSGIDALGRKSRLDLKLNIVYCNKFFNKGYGVSEQKGIQGHRKYHEIIGNLQGYFNLHQEKYPGVANKIHEVVELREEYEKFLGVLKGYRIPIGDGWNSKYTKELIIYTLVRFLSPEVRFDGKDLSGDKLVIEKINLLHYAKKNFKGLQSRKDYYEIMKDLKYYCKESCPGVVKAIEEKFREMRGDKTSGLALRMAQEEVYLEAEGGVAGEVIRSVAEAKSRRVKEKEARVTRREALSAIQEVHSEAEGDVAGEAPSEQSQSEDRGSFDPSKAISQYIPDSSIDFMKFARDKFEKMVKSDVSDRVPISDDDRIAEFNRRLDEEIRVAESKLHSEVAEDETGEALLLERRPSSLPLPDTAMRISPDPHIVRDK